MAISLGACRCRRCDEDVAFTSMTGPRRSVHAFSCGLPIFNRRANPRGRATNEDQDNLFHQGDMLDAVFFVVFRFGRLYRVRTNGREADFVLLPARGSPRPRCFLGHRVTTSTVAAELSRIIRLDSAKCRELAATDLNVAQVLTEYRSCRRKVFVAARTQPLIIKATLDEAVSEKAYREAT
ncbi:hypothetical protein ACWGS9_32715 [Bradyrhizobium sp. Arg314]